MSETPLPNDPAARSATGEILPPEPPKTPGAKPPEQTTETKPAETKPAETKAEAKPSDDKKPSLLNEKKPEAAAGAPEKYEAYKLPEGFTLNEKITEEANTIFKDIGLSQDGAQRLVDFYAKQLTEAAATPLKHWNDMQEKWQADVRNDPEIGNRLPQVKETIGRALDALSDSTLASGFREAMDLTGAGNHPAFVKAFYKLAQMVTEGRHVTGRNPSAHGQRDPSKGPATPAQALYPNLPSASS